MATNTWFTWFRVEPVDAPPMEWHRVESTGMHASELPGVLIGRIVAVCGFEWTPTSLGPVMIEGFRSDTRPGKTGDVVCSVCVAITPVGETDGN